jgi:2-dehydro-3-deoxyphosphogluconate aldolase/(4S)-4-hydroxy-2-oxoglutarate aldolase
VLTEETVQAASEAGAQFALAPGLNPSIVKRASELQLPFLPGVATPSEIELALSLGCHTLKFFPAELLGGAEMIKAFCAPYGPTGIRFIPTGGVSLDNLESYFACPHVAAVGGTWLARKDDLAGNNWAEIRQRCEVAMETVRRIRKTLK